MIGDLLGLASALTWALISVLLRTLQSRTNALSLNAFRSLVAAVLGIGVVIATGRLEVMDDFSRASQAFLVVSVLVGMGIGDTLYFHSLKLVGIVRGLLLSNSYPIFAALMASLLLHERITLGLLLGTLLVVLGVALVLVPNRALLFKSEVRQGENARLGVMLALLAGFFWACATILVRVGVQEMDGLAATTVRLIAATISLMLATRISRSGFQMREYRGTQLVGTVAAGVLTFLTSLTFLLSVQLVGAAKAATLTSTSPLFGAPMSLLMGEKMTWQTALGCIISVVGIWIVVAM